MCLKILIRFFPRAHPSADFEEKLNLQQWREHFNDDGWLDAFVNELFTLDWISSNIPQNAEAKELLKKMCRDFSKSGTLEAGWAIVPDERFLVAYNLKHQFNI